MFGCSALYRSLSRAHNRGGGKRLRDCHAAAIVADGVAPAAFHRPRNAPNSGAYRGPQGRARRPAVRGVPPSHRGGREERCYCRLRVAIIAGSIDHGSFRHRRNSPTAAQGLGRSSLWRCGVVARALDRRPTRR